MYSVEEFDQAKTKVLKYIMFQKRTIKEVKNKFCQIVEENLLEDVIEYLKQAGYLNDQEYIKRAVNNFIALKNLSLKELRYKLIAKGLASSLIETYFDNHKEELEEYEIQSARNLIFKKEKNMEIEELKQYLFKKGYQSELIKIALEEVGE